MTVGLDTGGDDLGVSQVLGQKFYIHDQAKGDMRIGPADGGERCGEPGDNGDKLPVDGSGIRAVSGW